MKKRIVCYGDSNTWGWIPMSGERYDETIRWPARLREILGDDYEIEEEGLPGRTTMFEDPICPHCDGYAYMPGCLLTNAPIDLLVFMLGTNDFQMHFSSSPEVTARTIRFMLESVRNMPITRDGAKLPILLLCPASISEHRFGYQPSDLVSQKNIDDSKALAANLAEMAQLLECEYLDLNEHVKVSERDGIHFEPDAHVKISAIVAERIKKIIG
ncbi:MAG: GDSL-type esterase/lipase family protein [Eubacteriales bacterium]|nr:GDSL-type esterase/lipase family protein [Eubacteriales bacterium]MDD4390418.1 GDSL-type esterase/lipase family protein [Eubacteriales bacterium]